MRIRVRLPKVEPGEYSLPKECPYEGCDGRFFKAHGVKGEKKALRDLSYEQVKSYRYCCLRNLLQFASVILALLRRVN